MSTAFHFQRRVEFRDTDAAGILHFASYFAYMEEAEHALLRSMGTSVMQEHDNYVIGWPRVSATCDFLGPVHFEQVLDIAVVVDRIGTKSVSYAFQFRDETERAVANGNMTSVCCRITHDRPPESIPVPTSLRNKLVSFGD